MIATRRQRKSIRLKEYDYSMPGGYFVTICTHNHENIFGEINDEAIHLLPIGIIAERCWNDIPKHFANVQLDEYIIMPNHVHGILVLLEYDHRRDLIHQILNGDAMNHSDVVNHADINQDVINHVPTNEWGLMKNPKLTLGKIVRHYKARTTKFIHDSGSNNFRWQSRFYEHVIRSDKELNNIRKYIAGNPVMWAMDHEHPDSVQRLFNADISS